MRVHFFSLTSFQGLEKSSVTIERNCKTTSDPHKLLRDFSDDCSFFILLGKTQIVFWGKTSYSHLSSHALLMWALVLGRQHLAFLKRLSLLLYLATHLTVKAYWSASTLLHRKSASQVPALEQKQSLFLYTYQKLSWWKSSLEDCLRNMELTFFSQHT